MSYIRFMNLKHKAPNQFGPIGSAGKAEIDAIKLPSVAGGLDFLPFVRKCRKKKKS